MPFSSIRNGKNVKAAALTAESKKPKTLKLINPAILTDPASSNSVTVVSEEGRFSTMLFRNKAERGMNAMAPIPTNLKVALQPNGLAMSQAIKGAPILPKSPAKFTAPTAVERDPVSYARDTIPDASGRNRSNYGRGPPHAP